MTAEPAAGPLSGKRVLDLTGTMSGPFCTLLLAQLGAEVVKIEPPRGDVTRHLTAGLESEMSPIFIALNAGKQAVALDLSTAPAREALLAALPDYDVVIHNMRPQAAARLGLTVDGLRSVGSTAVLCELVGFGPGPYEARPAYDDTIQAASGMAWVQGNGAEPAYVRTAIADKTAGLYAAVAVCAELVHRERGGGARAVRVPMFETLVAFTAAEQLGGLTFEPATGPPLYPRTASPHRRPFATADGHLSLMLYTDRHWEAFLREVGLPELIEDAAFATLGGRTANIDRVYGLVGEVLTKRTTADWLTVLERLDVPHAPVHSLADLLDDPHLTEAAVFEVAPDAAAGGVVRRVRSPFLFDGRRTADLAPARALGADTADFLAAHRQTTSPVGG